MNSIEARRSEICSISRRAFALATERSANFESQSDLVSQLLSSILSIGSNYAEGLGRRGTEKSSINFFRQARGSGYEAAFQASVAGWYDVAELIDEACNLLDSLIETAVQTKENVEQRAGRMNTAVGNEAHDLPVACAIGGDDTDPVSILKTSRSDV